MYTSEANTVVPATAGHRWFGAKVAGRGRWPLVTGNGHICAIMSNQPNTSDSIHFVAHARHYKAQRSITMLYTVRDETNNAENVWKKTTSFIHSVHLNTHIRCTVRRPGCMIHQVNWHLKNSSMVVCLALAACLTQFISTMFSSDVVASIIA